MAPMYRQSRQEQRGGFTLVELLVVIGIIALLISILLPTLRRAKDQADRVNCQSKLRQLVTGVRLYADDYKGWLAGPQGIIDPPGPETVPVTQGGLWKAKLIRDKRVWLCPADPRKAQQLQFSYTYNGRMLVKVGQEESAGAVIIPFPHYRKITSFHKPAEDIVFGEENVQRYGQYQINDAYFIYDDTTDNRHLGQSCVGYLDGHAGLIPPLIKIWSDRKWGYCR
jgi:prepilin-type N-terminal cleavage/methylation domain-containing protein